MNKKYFLAFAASTLMFVACGDDVTEIHQDGMAVLEKGEMLSMQACDTTNVGEMLFVMDSSAAFVCDGESWQTLKGADGKDGVDGENGADGKDGKDGVDGENGADGKDGKDGAKGDKGAKGDSGEDGESGENGTSCTATLVENDAGLAGLEVTCGETVVDTIWNGEMGESGENGKDGAGCKIVKDSAGVVTLACGEDETADTMTLFKATCGSIAFDPATQYCSQGIVRKYGYITDDRDGQTYKTVKVGDQVWMAENLNYDLKILPESETDSIQFSRCGGELNADNENGCSEYGRMYTWAAAMDSVAAFSNDGKGCGYHVECESNEKVRGICPEGWRLPSHSEWITLYTVVGETSRSLMSSWGWLENNNGSDAFGFSALPAGDGANGSVGKYAEFWSASESSMLSEANAIGFMLMYNNEKISMLNDKKNSIKSVRCIKD